MKKILLFFVFLLFLPVVFAQNWVSNSEYVKLNVDISGEINLISTGSRYSVDYVIANLSFIPKDGFQEEVLSIETDPVAEIEEGAAVFRWDDPSKEELDFRLKSDVKVYNKILEVKDKVNFPLGDLPGDIEAYTMPSETIDSDDKEIVRLASEIIKGEDDLYVVVFKLGDWTKKNIEYDLSTLTASVSQKASWVLDNREGVCDELTNLFIAMNRALGIPARFISGVAYTNAEQFEEGFGAHGWAEVYFPDYGWVPFDVTYGELGFVDASHLKLKESLDANDASTQFQWLGRDIDIKTNPLDIDVEIEVIREDVIELISIDAKSVKNDVGFGSYNLIEATVENLKDYYVATELVLSKSREIEIIGDVRKAVLLKPREEKDVNWIIKVSNNLDSGYIYTFPFVVSSLRNISSELRLDVREEGKRFSLEGMEDLIKEGEGEKSYVGRIELDCEIDENEIYEYETTIVECDIKNVGNVYLDDVNVCLEKDCKKVSLGITQEEGVSFNFEPIEAGSQEIVVKANNDEVSKSAFLDVVVYDEPSIEINELVYPEEVRYKDNYEISFRLDKKSIFAPYNVSIRVEPVNKEWELNQLSENRKFILKMFGSELRIGENEFEIMIEYKDMNGKSYSTSEEFTLSLVDVNIFQRITIFFKSIGRSIVSIFK